MEVSQNKGYLAIGPHMRITLSVGLHWGNPNLADYHTLRYSAAHSLRSRFVLMGVDKSHKVWVCCKYGLL